MEKMVLSSNGESVLKSHRVGGCREGCTFTITRQFHFWENGFSLASVNEANPMYHGKPCSTVPWWGQGRDYFPIL